jgi:hypothetical protein
MTLGYRVLYAYFASNGAVIVMGLNSQPNGKQNHDGALLEEVYGILRKAGKIHTVGKVETLGRTSPLGAPGRDGVS